MREVHPVGVNRENHTRHRTIRVPDDEWKAALAAAERRGENVTAAIRRFLRRYART